MNKMTEPTETNLVVRIAGEGGEGVISCGEMLTLALARSSYDVFTYRTYPAEIKGGPAMFQVRTGSGRIISQGDGVDVLVTFNQEAYKLHSDRVPPDGILLYDPARYEPPADCTFRRLPIPFEKIAYDEVKSKRAFNIVVLGILGQMMGLTKSVLERLVRDKFTRKGQTILETNLLALEAGMAYVRDHPLPVKLQSFPARPGDSRLVMTGNEALSIGALAAGCSVYFGYPITPASDILEYMEKELPKSGGTAVQTEDEMAALAAVIGASYAGRKAMTATSGPGFSLMMELLGLASMTEVPVVIINCQRGGPSTGLPTKTEQSDLNIAVYGSHGEAPRIVLATRTVEDCFYTIVQAFNLAEKYQIPVVLLSDANLSHRTQTFPRPETKSLEIINRLKPTAEDLKEYKRYKLTDSGISPMAVPGDRGVWYVATGLEHFERGNPGYTPELHRTMMQKRHRKLIGAAAEPGMTRRYGAARAKVGIIGWGSTQGSIEEAVDRLSARGIEVAGLQVKMIWPLPMNDLQAFFDSVETVIVAELNFTGQYANLLKAHIVRPVVSYTKCEGVPFNPGELVKVIEEVHHGKNHAGLPVQGEAGVVSRMR